MLRLTINQNRVYQLEPGAKPATGELNGETFNGDIISDEHGHLHVILNNRSVNVEILEVLKTEKKVKLKVGSDIFDVIIEDRFDILLKEMGMETTLGKELKEIKAPMPGLVLDILVNIGDEVEKDNPVIILEAMKMENVIKSSAKGIVKNISATKGNAVEKNQVLITFE
ncbi:MAG: acetyl-CoA carboxylase biotin carboxyl carrier protein subunit [Flavobacteriales bacterium]|nr:acetyl-CoA carboxylase biotin carboxyl carrier protein subunit [Flavobacteriales bacterium]